MARFGRDLVRSLTQPAFAGDVRQVGMLIGSMPARKEEEKKKTALIDLENQLRQTTTASTEAARTGDVESIELELKSINDQLNTERNEAKRKSLASTYALLLENLNTAREVQKTAEGQNRELDIAKAIRGGNLSSADGNAVGITTARMRLAKLLETETDEKRRSSIFSAMESLDEQLKGVDQVKIERNVDDLLKAERLYEKLEVESESRASILANADPESEEYLRAKNESAAMVGIKRRMDELKADPDTARKVKEQKGAERLAVLTQENQIQAAEETQAIAILSSLDPKSEKYKIEKQRFKDSNLGNAVKKVEKAAQEVETANLNYEKLLADVRPTPLTKEQIALGEKYGVIFREGTSREDILANRELLKSTLKIVSEMGTELALRDMKPLDEPAARAKLNVMLTDLKEQGDLPFAKDFLMTDLEDDLRDLSEEEQQYLIDSMLNKKPEEAEQILLEFIQEKFPESFEKTQTELGKVEKNQAAYQKAYNQIFADNPSMDKNNPVDQAMAEMAVEEELKNIRVGKTIENVMQGALM